MCFFIESMVVYIVVIVLYIHIYDVFQLYTYFFSQNRW